MFPILLVNVASTIKSCAIHHRACYVFLIYIASTEKGFVVFTASTNMHSKYATVITQRHVENIQYTYI